jgi:hypothetical protein
MIDKQVEYLIKQFELGNLKTHQKDKLIEELIVIKRNYDEAFPIA